MLKFTILIFVVITYAQIPEHLLEGLNEIYNRGAYAYYHVRLMIKLPFIETSVKCRKFDCYEVIDESFYPGKYYGNFKV